MNLIKPLMGLWDGEPDEKFPTVFDRGVHIAAWVFRCDRVIKYRSMHRWKLWPRYSYVRYVEPEMTWREIAIGRYGFSWIKLNESKMKGGAK